MASQNVKLHSFLINFRVWQIIDFDVLIFVKQLRTELVEQIDGQLNELLDDVLHDVDYLEPITDHSYSRYVFNLATYNS